VLQRGSAAAIERMVRELLPPGTRIRGRFPVLGFVTRDTPVENLRICYHAALRHGRIV
jgi:hypothetical protein